MDENKRRNYKICETHFDRRFIVAPAQSRKGLSSAAHPTLNLLYGDGGASTSQNVTEEEYSYNDSKNSRSGQTDLNLEDYKQSDKITIKNFLNISETVINKGLTQLVKWQIDNKNNNNQYSEGFMLFAFSLYNSSSSAYQFLKNTLNLPPVDALRKFVFPLPGELDQRTVNVLRTKVNNMTPQERICSVSVDCIPVKQSLFYDISNDRIIGFHEINGLQTIDFAKYAVVIIACGIIDNWKQPVAHWFVAKSDSVEISDALDEILDILIQIGLDVRVLVTKHTSDIVIPVPINPDEPTFMVAEREVFRVYDAPHLIKSLKEYFDTSHFIYNADHVLDEVYLQETAKELYNVLNCKNLRSTANAQPEEFQITFLHIMLNLFQHLKLINKDTELDVTETVSFIKGFQVTIKSILLLHERFEVDGLNFMLTNRLTLEDTKKFFQKVRKLRNCHKPTCRQVSKIFKKTFVRNIFTRPGGADHDDDFEKILQKMKECPNFEEPAVQVRNIETLAVETTDYNFELPESNVIAYISGYVYGKCIDKHSDCMKLNLFVLRSKTRVSEQFVRPIIRFPPDSFTDFIYLIEKKFQDFFRRTFYIKHVGNGIFDTIDCGTKFYIPCSCFPFDYAAKLFIRLRIYHTMKMNNKLLRDDNGDEKLFTAGNLNLL